MRIVIAEDAVLLRAGLTRLLVDAGEDVVATVGDADEQARVDTRGHDAHQLPERHPSRDGDRRWSGVFRKGDRCDREADEDRGHTEAGEREWVDGTEHQLSHPERAHRDKAVDGEQAPAGLAVGRAVQLTGTVQEFIPAADPGSAPLTQMANPTAVTVFGLVTLPTPVTVTPALLSPTGGLEQLARYEGMRVYVPSLTTVSGTTGFRNAALEAAGSSDPDGAFYAVLTGAARPFREPGVQLPDPLPAGARLLVAPGQRMIGGETVIAEFNARDATARAAVEF